MMAGRAGSVQRRAAGRKAEEMIREFKEFALEGNLLELAIAFVLGTAFAAVVASLVDDVIMNFIAAIVGKPYFSGLPSRSVTGS
jgi:large conductance mechanosensitive channel protein